jgi:RNA recognition motif-containing protein
MKKLYVGNLSFDSTDEELRQLFEAHGAVESAKVATDRDSGRSRGFGFIEMTSDHEAESAIAALNGTQVSGRALIVNEARPKTSGFGGGGYGGGRPGGSGRDGNRRSGGGGRGGSRW